MERTAIYPARVWTLTKRFAMGDHRVSIKIQFEMHGHKDTWDSWLNWSDTIPERVTEWIMRQKEKAMDNWFEEEYGREQMEAAKRENHEREELARLKAKYEQNGNA